MTFYKLIGLYHWRFQCSDCYCGYAFTGVVYISYELRATIPIESLALITTEISVLMCIWIISIQWGKCCTSNEHYMRLQNLKIERLLMAIFIVLGSLWSKKKIQFVDYIFSNSKPQFDFSSLYSLRNGTRKIHIWLNPNFDVNFTIVVTISTWTVSIKWMSVSHLRIHTLFLSFSSSL